jgi:type I restriction enzyme S subunit
MLTLKEQTMLGNIPSDWNSKPLKVLLRDHFPGDWGEERGVQMVKVLRSTNLTNRGRLNLSDIAQRSLKPRIAERLAPQKNDILLERSGGGPDQPVGRVGFIESAMPGYAFSNFLHLLSPDQNCINPRFLGWILWRINQTRRILRLEQQTTQMRNLNFRDYLLMPIPIPPPEEQATIAHILDSMDTAIECTREAVEQAREVRTSLLADLLSRGISKNGRVRNTENDLAAFTHTSFGRVPSDWEISSVGKEFDLQNGFTLNEDRRPRNRKRPYLRVANVHRDTLDLRDIQELEAKDAEFLPRILEVNDLLVVEGHADRMQIGRCARVTQEAVGMTFQNHLFRLRAIGKVIPYFGCLWLNSAYAQRYWNACCATSSGLNTINQRLLKRLIIPAPSLLEQEAIGEVVAAQRTYLETLGCKLNRLISLRTSLMHDLLTGKVRVNNLNLAAMSNL